MKFFAFCEIFFRKILIDLQLSEKKLFIKITFFAHNKSQKARKNLISKAFKRLIIHEILNLLVNLRGSLPRNVTERKKLKNCRYNQQINSLQMKLLEKDSIDSNKIFIKL
jgi:hypothetical protein